MAGADSAGLLTLLSLAGHLCTPEVPRCIPRSFDLTGVAGGDAALSALFPSRGCPLPGERLAKTETTGFGQAGQESRPDSVPTFSTPVIDDAGPIGSYPAAVYDADRCLASWERRGEAS